MTRPVTDPWAEGGLRVWDDYQFRRKGIRGGGPSKVKLRAPYNQVPPVISGMLVTDGVLSCTTGTWGGTAPITYAYQWYEVEGSGFDGDELLLVSGLTKLALVNGLDNLLLAEGSSITTPSDILIPGATESTFVVPVPDPVLPPGSGKYYYCVVTATNAYGSASAQSNTLGPMEEMMPPPATLITDLAAANTQASELWLTWTPVPGSKGTVIYRSREEGTLPHFKNWQACRIAFPGNSYRDGCEGPLDLGRYYTYQAAAFYDNGEGPLSAPVRARTQLAFEMGFQMLPLAHPITDYNIDIISDVTAVYNVPAPPSAPIGTFNNIYYFIATQNQYYGATYVEILQPVVAFGHYFDDQNPDRGGDYWWLANWMGGPDRFYISPALKVPDGVTSVTGKIVRNGVKDYTIKFVEYPALDLHMTGLIGEQYIVMGALEEWIGDLQDWSHNPGDITIDLLNLSLTTSGPARPVRFDQVRANLSGSVWTVIDNNTPTPKLTLKPQHNNDWVPVNM